MSGWPYSYSYHVLAWFNGDPTVLPKDDVRCALRRMPPMCLVPLVMGAAEEVNEVSDETIEDAARSRYALMIDGDVPVVRILAVHADGTEAPQPTYEEALAELAAIEAAIPSSIVPTHTEHGGPMGLAARVRILAVEATCEVETAAALAAARAEVDRLRGEVETMRGQRDAFRDHLDLAHRNACTERAAWARLVEAEQVHHAQTVLLGERDDDAKGAFAEVVAARQALRGLGVDVGSWLGEGPAS